VLLVAKLGFASAMLVTTAIMLIVLVPAVVVWVDPPPWAANPGKHQSESSDSSQIPRAEQPLSRAMVVRRLAFWTIALPFALALTAQIGFLVHQIALLEPKIGRSGAGLAVAVTTFMAVMGRISLGLVVDRFDPRWATAASLVSQAAALFAISQTDNAPIVFAASATFGFSVGNLITLPPLIIHREFEAGSFAVVMGLSTAMTGAIGALGPVLVGLVRGWSGDYGAALALCISLQLLAATIVLKAGKRPDVSIQ
jgi:cyanate permease